MCPYGNTDLCLYSLQPDTNLHCETVNTGLVYGAAYQFTPQLSLVLTATTHGGMARLSLPVCLVKSQNGADANRTRKRYSSQY